MGVCSVRANLTTLTDPQSTGFMQRVCFIQMKCPIKDVILRNIQLRGVQSVGITVINLNVSLTFSALFGMCTIWLCFITFINLLPIYLILYFFPPFFVLSFSFILFDLCFFFLSFVLLSHYISLFLSLSRRSCDYQARLLIAVPRYLVRPPGTWSSYQFSRKLFF